MAFVLVSLQTARAESKTQIDAGRKYLVLDSRIIASTDNAKLEVGKVVKHKANPLFIEDKAWEMRYDNLYGNVIYDKEAKIYKCWYSPFIIDAEWSRKMTLEQRKKTRYRARAGRWASATRRRKMESNGTSRNLGS